MNESGTVRWASEEERKDENKLKLGEEEKQKKKSNGEKEINYLDEEIISKLWEMQVIKKLKVMEEGEDKWIQCKIWSEIQLDQ